MESSGTIAMANVTSTFSESVSSPGSVLPASPVSNEVCKIENAQRVGIAAFSCVLKAAVDIVRVQN